MKPNTEREAYCKYCGKYMGVVDYDYVCPIGEEDHCESKKCLDVHHEECEKPYIEWLNKREEQKEQLKAKYPQLSEEKLEEAATNIMMMIEAHTKNKGE